MEFKVGDRVTAISDCGSSNDIIGKSGTVIEVNAGYPGLPLLVEFDQPLQFGHNGGIDGIKGKPNHCLYCRHDNFKPEAPPC